jgi:hypothetical protein
MAWRRKKLSGGNHVRVRKYIAFPGVGRVFVAASLAAVALYSAPAKAEDFCDTLAILSELGAKHYEKAQDRLEEMEKRIREKCKAGDIIVARSFDLKGRVCDLRQHVDEYLCYLAAPRKTY